MGETLTSSPPLKAGKSREYGGLLAEELSEQCMSLTDSLFLWYILFFFSFNLEIHGQDNIPEFFC
jgi:hypothetical protein